jgi:lipoprotein-anchoring transpeptidase ErfK/SrfK
MSSHNLTLIVEVRTQRLYVVRNGRHIATYRVSTSAYGVGNREGSQQTPPGKHVIARKIGHGAAPGAVFRGRVPTGAIAPISQDRTSNDADLITTRILWLRGLEPGLNAGKGIDSYDRYIYIHGTPAEGLIGEPASHGCIRMKNREVIKVFELVSEGTMVEIIA